MAIDKRFALVRNNGELWYAAIIKERGKPGGAGTYHVSIPGKTRDAYKQAEYLLDIEIAVKRVLQEKQRMRFRKENGKASSLHLKSRGVEGYVLAPILAAKLGFPPTGTI